MALSSDSLKSKLITELHALGFVTDGQFAKSADFAEAIAKAVVSEITQNAAVEVTAGSSAGSYKVS